VLGPVTLAPFTESRHELCRLRGKSQLKINPDSHGAAEQHNFGCPLPSTSSARAASDSVQRNLQDRRGHQLRPAHVHRARTPGVAAIVQAPFRITTRLTRLILDSTISSPTDYRSMFLRGEPVILLSCRGIDVFADFMIEGTEKRHLVHRQHHVLKQEPTFDGGRNNNL